MYRIVETESLYNIVFYNANCKNCFYKVLFSKCGKTVTRVFTLIAK